MSALSTVRALGQVGYMQKRHMRAQEKAAIFLHFIYPLAGNRKTGQASKTQTHFFIRRTAPNSFGLS